MSDQSIIRIEHRQDLTLASDAPQWSESVQVIVSFFSDALTSGWLGQFCGRHANDLIVLLAIGFHGSPLRGDWLHKLISLGQVKPEDEGRLCCVASDKALADELGTTRETVGASTGRLEARGMVSIVDLRPLDSATGHRHPLQSENGAYLPCKVYLIAGNLSRMLSKSVNRVGKADTAGAGEPGQPGVGKADTVESGKTGPHGVGKADTVHAQTVSGKPTQIVKSLIGGGGGDAPLALNFSPEDQALLARFLECIGQPHAFSEKELKALAGLRAAGYSQPEILAGVDRAFDRPGRCRHFTFVAALLRNTPPAARPETQPSEGVRQPEPTRKLETGSMAAEETLALDVPPELAETVRILREQGETLTEAKLARLQRMVEEYQPAAARHGATAAAWIEKAMTQGLGEARSSLIGYADTILRRWARQGPDAEAVPPAGQAPAQSPSRGHKSAAKKSTAAERIARTAEALTNYRRPDGD